MSGRQCKIGSIPRDILLNKVSRAFLASSHVYQPLRSKKMGIKTSRSAKGKLSMVSKLLSIQTIKAHITEGEH